MTCNNVYIGWDSKQDIAYKVLKHSILRKSKNIDIIPLKQKELRDKKIYKRPAVQFNISIDDYQNILNIQNDRRTKFFK